MTKYKEILRLHSLGINNTRVAESCGCARSTVISTVQRAQEKEIAWEDIRSLSEAEVARRLYPATSMGRQYKMPDYEYCSPGDTEKWGHTESSLGRILQAVPGKWRAPVSVHPIQQVLRRLCPQD